MAREKRIHRAGLVYHVINRGNNRQAIFLEEEDYKLYLGLLYRYKRKFNYKLFAYCLMTNHAHLLIQVGEKGTISQIMQGITNAHTRHYHFKYRTSGHIWQGRFKSPIVGGNEHMLTVMTYIEQNPVRAGLTQKIEGYRWTSYLLNVKQKTSKLIDREDNVAFMSLGVDSSECIAVYQERTRQRLEEYRLEDVRRSIKTGGGYLSEQFKRQMQELLPKKRLRGRPRKQVEEFNVN